MCYYVELQRDLFSRTDVSFAHCVSADFYLTRGTALRFKRKFGYIEYLLRQRKQAGQCAILPLTDERYIYYLVTKDKFWHKPTYKNLIHSLYAMKNHCVKYCVRELWLPRVGCGFDKLDWPTVSHLIENVIFCDVNMKIVVCWK